MTFAVDCALKTNSIDLFYALLHSILFHFIHLRGFRLGVKNQIYIDLSIHFDPFVLFLSVLVLFLAFKLEISLLTFGFVFVQRMRRLVSNLFACLLFRGVKNERFLIWTRGTWWLNW